MPRRKHVSRSISPAISHAVAVLLTLGVFAATWYVGGGVIEAYRQTQKVHVFATTVRAQGWNNPEGALVQDLSAEAQFVAFSPHTSAHITLGSRAAGTSHLPETPRADEGAVQNEEQETTEDTVTESSDGDTTTPETSEVVETPEATETAGEAPAPAESGDVPVEVAPPAEVPPASAPVETPAPTSYLPETFAEVVFMFVPRARAAVDTVDAATDLATETVSTTESVLETVTHSELPTTEPLTDDISLCVTLGVPCHTIELGAFTLSPELTEKSLEHVDLNFSFGSAAPEGEGTDDKLVVRYYLNGQWRHGGEIFLNKEMSNAANGGYFTASLTDVREWEDLSDMRVVVEYVRADNRTFAELYLDSVWLDVSYKDRFADPDRGLGEDAELPENVATELASRDADVARSLLIGDGTYVLFPYIDDIDEETVAIRADKALYTAQGDAERNEVFVSVTNTSRESDLFTLSAAFPGSGGRMESLQQFMSNVPLVVETPVYDNLTYFCESSWVQEEGGYRCVDTGALEQCTWLNEESQNCLVERVQVGTHQETQYQRAWVDRAVVSAPVAQPESLHGLLPTDYEVTMQSAEPIEVLPGQTVYFKVTLASTAPGPQAFALFVHGNALSGDLISTQLAEETVLLAELEADQKAARTTEVNRRLSPQTSFDGDDVPKFTFKFASQRSLLTQAASAFLGIDSDFTVRSATLRHVGGESEDVPVHIVYEENGEWSLEFTKHPRSFRPGKYTLELTMKEGFRTYEDTVDFYWGVLAVNTDKTVYEPNEPVRLMMAALDDAGNTICNAHLTLSISTPEGSEVPVAVRESGVCGPNNVVDVADYLADYSATALGRYSITLSHMTPEGQLLHRITDSFEVREQVPFVVSRTGPTRIYPKAPYAMTVTVTARRDFSGVVEEFLPLGTVVSEDHGGYFTQFGDTMRLSWDVELREGETRTFAYAFDAPDISPYLYVFGPLVLREGETKAFEELRSWKVASDALGSYVEKYQAWSPTTAASWKAKSLASAPFSVPAGAVVEVAVVNSDTANERTGGVRHASSTLTRSFLIHEAEPQGKTVTIMHVQASATSSIQTYAEDTTNISFVLLGYWTSGYYTERMDQIDPGITNATWGNINLNSYGVASGTIAEMVLGNWNANAENNAGVRRSGSSLNRFANVHESEAGGINTVTMHVMASSSNATIQGYAQVEGANGADVDYYLVGYWNQKPTGLEYNERFDDLGGPGTGSTWTDRALDGFSVPPEAIAEVMFANAADANLSAILGVRTNGSTIDRSINLHEAEAGGWSIARAHVKADSTASSTIEYYTDDTANDQFRLFGYWAASNTPALTPTLYNEPFNNEKTGTSTPTFRFSSTDPDGSSDIVYEIEWDDDPTLDDAPLGSRSSSNETGCSPNCFQNITSGGDTSPFTEGNQIRFTIQSPLVSGTTYYWRVRATDITGSTIPSEWSAVKSFTYVANTDPSQWMQTQDTQFDSGSFDNTETYGSNSVRLTTSAPTEALVAYAEGTVQTPRYRLWTGSAWGAEASAQSVGGTIQWIVTKAAPTRNEYLLATQDAVNDINVQVYNGGAGTWGNLTEVTAGAPSTQRRSFDLAYESTSGDGMIVYCDGDADPSYQIWNGTSWNAGTINLNSANNCEYIKLASNPISDEIVMVARDTGTQYEAQVWNGSSWNDSVVLGSMSDVLHEGIAVEYEESGDQVVVAVSNGLNSSFSWSSWDGLEWSLPTPQTLGDDFEWGVLKRDEGSDNMALCYVDEDDDIGVVRWDGAGWQTFDELDTVSNVSAAGTADGRPVSCEFETTTGRDGYIMTPYSDTGAARSRYWNGSTWSTPEVTISTIQDAWTVSSIRTGEGKILMAAHDDVNARYDFSYWDGSSWSTAQTLENTTSVTAEPFREPIDMTAKLYQSRVGTTTSEVVNFSLVTQNTWGEARWNTTEPTGTDVKVQVMYASGGVCSSLVPDAALPGNSSGYDVTAAPLNLSSLSTTTYNGLCLRAVLSSTNASTPTLDDWTITWERQPFLTQTNYKWYVNTNAATPTDIWPSGATDINENEAIAQAYAPSSGAVMRLRMNILAENVALSTGALTLTLQYAEGATCSESMTWLPVGGIGSTTAAWRGYNNAAVSDGATLSSVLLSTADTVATYEEENDSSTNPNAVSANNEGEWDWVLEHNATAGTSYCFRVITAQGETLDEYDRYPALVTNRKPNTPALEAPFDNEQLASTTPWFEFSAEDAEGNDVTYQVQIDNDTTFASPVIDRDSQTNFTEFSNVITPADKDPFTSGQIVRFVPTTALTNGTTYYWRVRGKDRNASATWSDWSSTYSVTINTGTTITTWYQTTAEQFTTNTFDDTEVSGNDVILTTGFTPGTTTGAAIDFDDRTTGNAWGSLSWNDNETTGDIRYRIEYLNGSTWTMVPDADLSGNSSGFGTSPVSLLSLSPTTYNQIRVVATLTNIGGTPRLLDWTVAWGLAVEQPTQYTLFDNEKTGTTTPTFTFESSDPQNDDLVYEVSISTSPSFTASTTRTSNTHGGFTNTASSTDTSPFVSGDRAQFKVQVADALTNNTTYWWRVRAKDPTGGNVWSVWSPSRSFTVDTAITVSTWFQTTDDQFSTDTLTDTEISGSNSVRVSTVRREAFVAYAESTVQAPRYRLWNGTTWAAEGTALSIGAPIYWVEAAAAPTRDEYIVVTMASTGRVDAQVFNGTTDTWGNKVQIGTASNNLRRGFDVAYETTSGDAVVVSCAGTEAAYRVWNGSAWDVATSSITLAVSNNCEWLKLASDPASDEMIMVARDTTAGVTDYQALVWSGSAWANSSTFGSQVTAANEGIAIEYEESGGQAVAAVSNGANNNFIYNTWNGTIWQGTNTVTTGNDFAAGRLARDSGSDELGMCYIDIDGDIGYVEWNGGSWPTAFAEVELVGNSINGRPVSCEFETSAGRDNFVMIPYSDDINARYQYFNGTTPSGEADLTTITDSWELRTVRTGDGNILAVAYDDANTEYDFSYWNGTAWSTEEVLETSSITTTAPATVPIDIVERRYPSFTSGTLTSDPIVFSDGNGPKWQSVSWNDTTPGSSDILYGVEYYASTTDTWARIPDSAIPGNSVGTTTSPIDLSNISRTTYNTIRTVANLTCVGGNCPSVNDWTVAWSEGIVVSGTAQAYDQSTNVTSGTVAIAVNGVLQTGKTATISSGTWSISNVTVFENDVVTVFIDGATDSAEAAAVLVYDGTGDITGVNLYERHLTLGSADNQTITNANIGQYDNSVSGDEDVFFDVDAGNDLSACAAAVSGCADVEMVIKASNTYRPDSTSSGNVTTHDIEINGTVTADNNTFYIGGSWDNNSVFTKGVSTVVFTATSTTETVDSTGATTANFNAVTFGQTSGSAQWNLSSALDIDGALTVSYGTLNQNGNKLISIGGNLSFGASGAFTKGTASTTFDGTGTSVWTDSTAAKQDMGDVVVNGTTKIINLGSGVKATNITIGADDTLSVDNNYALEVKGSFTNNNSFLAQNGTVTFTATGAGNTITAGSSSFYNLTFNGVGGNWSFVNSTLTIGNNFTVATGTVTMPTATTTITGSFANTGGTFMHNNGTVSLTASTAKTIQTNSSSFYDLQLNGTGSWSFVDSHATTSRNFIITAGSVTLPGGTLAVGGSFAKNGGSFAHNSGTLRMTASTAQTIRLGGTDLRNLTIAGSGSWSFVDTAATTTNTVHLEQGTLTFPSGTLSVGGSLTRTSGGFSSNTGTVIFNSADTGETVAPGTSTFHHLTFDSTTGGWTITENATSTGNTTISRANSFTLSSGAALEVGGTFTNSVGGAATTWTGSTLYLNSGTAYSLNTKSVSGDTYGTLLVGASTDVRMWNSSASTATTVNATGSLYSQDHAAVDGDLYIYGEYVRSTGSDYWSYATDFDGTALGVSSRAVQVRVQNSSSLTFSGGTLAVVGTQTASTTIANQGSGTYGFSVTGAGLQMRYVQVRNTDTNGLSLSGTTAVSTFSDLDLELGINAGSLLTLSGAMIDANPALQVQAVRFATSSGVTSGYNVTVTGTPSSYWWFRSHYGNLAGEAYDNDPGGDPGNARFDDSAFIISISGTVYSDDGATPLGSPTCDGATAVVTVKVNGGGSFSTPCNAGDGTFTVSSVAFTGDSVFTTFLNTNGGVRAVTVTKTATGNITGLPLYQNQLVIRHEDVAGVTIANLEQYDSDDDADVFFDAELGSPHTLVTEAGTGIYVLSGKTFAPGGNITLTGGGSGAPRDGRLHLGSSAVFTASGTESHSIGGWFSASSSALFTPANSSVSFTATNSGNKILAESAVSFYDLAFTGVGGGWSLENTATTTVQNTISLSQGTVSGTGNLHVAAGGFTGTGTLAMTGGLVRVDGTGSLGGNTAWQFNSLMLGGTGSGTITKTGSGTTTVLGLLRVAASETLQAGSSPWVLAGTGTVFSVGGTFTVQTAPFYYTGTSATTILDTTYAALTLAPSSGSPTYTIGGGTLTATDIAIGDGSAAVTVNANTNDPSLSITNDLTIRAAGTLVASNIGAFEVGGSWDNDGTFTSSSGTVTFTSTDGGELVAPGSSTFHHLTFDSTTGGWSITENATSTGNTTISRANSFTLSSGAALEVGGTFTNSVGGAATTWTGSTLYLNSGTAYSLNTKAVSGDTYDTLLVGASTDVRMWNSSASTATTVNATGSLYSQDHAAVDGDLYIYGEYVRSTGSDYWSYATDFDGSALGGGARQVDVRVASSSSISMSGGVLDIIGDASATTTITNQGTGTFTFAVSGGTLNAQYYSLRHTGANGLSLSGSPTLASLSDGDFELGVEGGSMITVSGSAITANPLEIISRASFATSTGISTGYNVRATGTTVSSWKFNLHYGTYDGEAYDDDPAGDPGYIRWDDSASDITISGSVYSDEGTTVSGVCDNSTQVVTLKVQGAGSYTSSCDSTTGEYSIDNVFFNPGDVLTVFLNTGGGVRAANISIDPVTNITDMHLYENRTIVRHEDTAPLNIADMAIYDNDQDSDIPFDAEDSATDTLLTFANTKVIVWSNKTFAPAGNMTLESGGSGSAWDGSLELLSGATLSAAGTQSHSVGGSLTLGASAVFSSASSTITMTATTTGKTITPQASSFYNLTFNGTGGNWSFVGGAATTTNNFTISNGTVTLPTATTTVGGSFTNSGGTFMHNNGVVVLTSTVAGKSIQTSGSSFYALTLNGVGGTWSFTDTNATTSSSFTVTNGTVTLPSGILAVGGSFDNSGTFTHNSGTVKMTATATGKTVRAGGSPFYDVTFNGVGGGWTFADTNASTTNDMTITNGAVVLPSGRYDVAGSWLGVGGSFDSNLGTVTFTSTDGGELVAPGSSTFHHLTFDSTTGGWSITENATSTGNTTISRANSFTLSSGAALEVGGTFTNSVGGAATTWTGSTLYLNSGTAYSLNTKAVSGDTYDTLLVGASTDVRMWNSSASTATTVNATGSLYSQDHAAVDGDLYIYGEYVRSTGSDYWSYATDFDGSALGGGARQVDVRVASSSSVTYSGGSLAMVGTAAATTTVRVQGTGAYSMSFSGSSNTLNASYYEFKNLTAAGLSLAGSVGIVSLSSGDFELSANGGTLMTVASTTLDANASLIISGVRFATSTGITSGYNVTRSGTPIGAWTFTGTLGNLAGESYDNDGGDACGYIRWSDSACLFVNQAHYRFRADDGNGDVPSSEWYNASWSKRKKIGVTNNATTSLTDYPTRIEVSYDADMQTDFDDLRFTDDTGTTSISYWIENVAASATATVWVSVPYMDNLGTADIYVYYGNNSATDASDGDATFDFFDDFEDGNITEYSGDTSKFSAGTTFNYHGTYGLDAGSSFGDVTTSGIYRTGSLVGQGDTIRFFQYVDGPAEDEPCAYFGVQASAQNYAVCLDQYPTDRVVLAENVTSNDGSGTYLASTSVTFATGWYEVIIDWFTNNVIRVSVYDDAGDLFATTTATDASYTSGGVGFGYWFQYGGWDFYSSRQYISEEPTYVFGGEQGSGGATWLAAEDEAVSGIEPGDNIRLRFSVQNTGAQITGQTFRLQYASKGAALNCESVPYVNYNDVPTTSSGCGSHAACMTTSTQITNNASTAGLLSYPASLSFALGQLLEDPSNETTSMTVDANHATEIEYNFQLTSSATDGRYCFRTTDGGLDLDNYAHIAELLVQHPPTITNWSLNNAEDIALTEGATTTVIATGTVSDLNGYTDILFATSTFYRSAVTANCSDNLNSCYQIASTSCLMSDCAGTSCTLTCSADIEHFADPTDAGIYAAQNWLAGVFIEDSTGLTDSDTSLGVELMTLFGLSVDTSVLNFGSLYVGEDTGSTNAVTSVQNTGNANIDIDLLGTDLEGTSSTIAVGETRYATSTFVYGACSICQFLTGSATQVEVDLPKPTSTSTPIEDDIYWGINIPLGTGAELHQGTNTFIATSD